MFPDLLCDDVFRLETRRLWLRWPRMADVPAFLRLAGEREVAEMTATIPHPYCREAAEKFVFASRAGNASGRQIALALARKDKPNAAIGMIGVHETRPGHAFIGYWIGRPFQQQGLMSEAAAAVIDLAFQVGDIEEIVASARTDNEASRKVLEGAGFVPAGSGMIDLPARGGLVACDRFRLDHAGWQAHGAQTRARSGRRVGGAREAEPARAAPHA